MKRLVVFVLLLSLCTFLAVAGGKPESQAAPKEVVTVVGPWAGEELDQFRPVLQAFEQRENVTVKYLTYRAEDLASVLPAQFQAKQALADVIFMWDWWIRDNNQYATDLSGIWSGVKDAFIPDALSAGGKIAAIPYSMGAKPGFWYRKSFFNANGLSVPRTRDEFAQLLRDIAAVKGVKNPIITGDGTGWPISDVTEHILIAVGGVQLENNLIAKKVKWTDPNVRAVFTDTLVPMLQQGAFSDPVEWTQAVELWWGKEYGLYFMGNWITGMVDDATDLGVFPFPGTKAVVTSLDFAFVPTFADQADLAQKLLTFMVSKEGQEIRAKAGGKIMPRKDIPSTMYPVADQAVAQVMTTMETTVNDLDDSIGGDWQRLFWDQLKLLWVSPGSLDDVLRKLQDGLTTE